MAEKETVESKVATVDAVPIKAEWVNHVSKHVPANWTGQQKDYYQLFKAVTIGVEEQIQRGLALQFEDIVSSAIQQLNDGEKPVVESVIKLRFNLEDIHIANVTGLMTTEKKEKFKTEIKVQQDLDPKQTQLPFSGEKSNKDSTETTEEGDVEMSTQKAIGDESKKSASPEPRNKGEPTAKKTKVVKSTRGKKPDDSSEQPESEA